MELEEAKKCIFSVIENSEKGQGYPTLFLEMKKECGKSRRCPHLYEFNRAIRSLVKEGKIKETSGKMYSLSLE